MGNQGIDVRFSRRAPKGKYRVVGVDTFDGTDWHDQDFSTKEAAMAYALHKGGNMLKYYVYDDTGNYVADAGVF